MSKCIHSGNKNTRSEQDIDIICSKCFCVDFLYMYAFYKHYVEYFFYYFSISGVRFLLRLSLINNKWMKIFSVFSSVVCLNSFSRSDKKIRNIMAFFELLI